MKNILPIFLMLFCQYSFAQMFELDTLQWSGSNDNRISLVILGDGYVEDELTKFRDDANDFKDALFEETPYKEYQNYFNVFAINVISNESGASHPGTATDVTEPSHPVSIVDNYFGSTFDGYGVHRLLYAQDVVAINTVLALNFPTYDQTIILVNSPHYGGSGGNIPVSSVGVNAEEVAIHEIGHSFVGLKDEYYPGDAWASEGINMSSSSDSTNVRWKNWLDTGEVGIYQHCCVENAGDWYKPHESCKMEFLNNPFCSVCIEGTIERIHTLVDVIDSYAPDNSSDIDLSNPTVFGADLVVPIPNTLDITWSLNEEILDHTADSLLLTENDLIDGENTLQMIVADTTDLLRIANHEYIHYGTIVWNINSGLVAVEDIRTNNLKIALFPNPTTEVLYFNVINEKQQDFSVAINDLLGNQIIKQDFKYSDNNSQIQLGDIPSGAYVVKFTFADKLVISRKLIKE